MKSYFSIFVLLGVLMPLFLLFSCVKPDPVPAIDGEAEVVLQASIAPAPVSATAAANAANAATRATATAFEVGDEIGLFAVKQGVALLSSKNMIDNAKLKVASDAGVGGAGTVIKGDPTALYYPNRGDRVDFYSYFPYQSGDATADALGVLVGIRTTQADFSSFKSSDLCYGSIKSVTPTNSAQKITYTHLFAQLKLNFTTYPDCPAIKEVNLLNIKDSASLNLATGLLTSKPHTATISTFKASDNQFIGIIPSQTLSGQCIEVTLDDNSTYIYSMAAPQLIVAGSTNTFNLAVGNNSTLIIKELPLVSSWENVAKEASVSSPITNDFSVLWRTPHKNLAAITKVLVTLVNDHTHHRQVFQTTAFALHSADQFFAKMSFSLSVPQGEGFSYPYRIDAVVFMDQAGSEIQYCGVLVAATVNRSGSYTLGIDENNILALTSGAISSWDELMISGGISGGGVDNSFVVRIIEPLSTYNLASTLVLTIDGFRYQWDATADSGSNILLAQMQRVKFPDRNNKFPTIYPYSIERVEVMTAGGDVVVDRSCYIEITRAGAITLNVSQSGISKTSATVSGWGVAGGAGLAEVTSVATSNPMRLIFCDGVDGKSQSVEKVVLTIDNQEISVSPYIMTTSNPFIAESTASIDVIKSGVGTKPPRQPYTITSVRLLDQSGNELFNAPCQIKVRGNGEFTLRAMK